MRWTRCGTIRQMVVTGQQATGRLKSPSCVLNLEPELRLGGLVGAQLLSGRIGENFRASIRKPSRWTLQQTNIETEGGTGQDCFWRWGRTSSNAGFIPTYLKVDDPACEGCEREMFFSLAELEIFPERPRRAGICAIFRCSHLATEDAPVSRWSYFGKLVRVKLRYEPSSKPR